MPTTYHVDSYRGKPSLFIDGEPSPACTYCYANDPKLEKARRIHDKFIEHGYRFFMPQVRGGVDDDWDTSPFWTGDNVLVAFAVGDLGFRGSHSTFGQ
jgi:hypothetical protein